MALRMTTSSRAFAAAALKIAVKPWSSMTLAYFIVFSVCSSGGMSPRPSSVEVSQKLIWPWDSMRPGISVAPPPSTVWAPSRGSFLPALAICLMRLPSTSTSPA